MIVVMFLSMIIQNMLQSRFEKYSRVHSPIVPRQVTFVFSVRRARGVRLTSGSSVTSTS